MHEREGRGIFSQNGLVDKLLGVEAYRHTLIETENVTEARASGALQILVPLEVKDERDWSISLGRRAMHLSADVSSLLIGTVGVGLAAVEGDIKLAGAMVAGKVIYNVGAHVVPEAINRIKNTTET